MAHRTQFSKDIILPPKIQEYRIKLQKQIQELRNRQKSLTQQNNQNLLMLEKRLLYGKKKIFTFGRQIDHMTLTDQLTHYNLEIQSLKKAIYKEQQAIMERQKQQLQQLKIQYVPSRTYIPSMEQQIQKQRAPLSPSLRNSKNQATRNKISDHIRPSLSMSGASIRNITDPQQQLMKLTHEIMRLKKSLQQVRSKYSDNFTEYKLRQQYEKLKQQNATMTQQLKQLQTTNNINRMHQMNNEDVDYDQLQIITIRKQYELLLRDKQILESHLRRLVKEEQERKASDQGKVVEFREGKIENLRKQIKQVAKNNSIMRNQIKYIEDQILARKNYQQQLRTRLPL